MNDIYGQREEERISWRLHRAREAGAAETQWLNHSDANRDVRAFSDSKRVQDGLIVDGLLFPIAMRPTLRLDDRAREVARVMICDGVDLGWDPVEFFAEMFGEQEEAA